MIDDSINLVTNRYLGDDWISTPGGSFKHFTGLTALCSIVKSGKLRMSRHNGMKNDVSEGEYVKKLYREVIDELLKEDVISASFYHAILDPPMDYRRVFSHSMTHSELVECDPYVVCLSATMDDTVMGPRYYGDEIGGWLEFNSKDVILSRKQYNPSSCFDDCGMLRLCKVSYDDEWAMDRIRRMVLSYKETGSDDYQRIAEGIGACLSSIRLVVKSPVDDLGRDTIVEKETRLILYVPKDKDFLNQYRDEMSDFELSEDGSYAWIPLFKNTFDSGLSVRIVTMSGDVAETLETVSEGYNFEMHPVDVPDYRTDLKKGTHYNCVFRKA